MLKNYVKVGLRNILRYKGFFIINVSGLSVGITCFLLILIYVKNELSFDTYHKNYDSIYRILHAYQSPETAKDHPLPEDFQVYGNAPAGPALKEDFPEVRQFFRFASRFSFLLDIDGNKFREDHIVFADSSVFEMFSWKLLHGDPKTALSYPGSFVLTKSLAKKLFGNEDPIGKSIRVLDYDQTYHVTGVMEDVPSNSHFSFSGLASMITLHQMAPGSFNDWGHRRFYTYVLADKNIKFESLNQKIPKFVQNHYPDGDYTIAFEPLADAYLHSKATKQPDATGNLSNIYLFSCIGIFILLIACVNFINLSIAQSVERAKEVGVRKTIGALRKHLVLQFLTESTITTILSAALAIGLVLLAMPVMRTLSGKPLELNLLFFRENALMLIALILAIGVLVGGYPALILSRFKPIKVLKGKFSSSSQGNLLRKTLVVFQFGLTITLIAGTLIVFQQLKHLQNYDLGFSQEQLLVVDFDWERNVQNQLEIIKREFMKRHDVVSVSASRSIPGDFSPAADTEIEQPDGAWLTQSMALFDVGMDFISNYEVKMLAGRAFSKDFVRDSTEALIVNRSAIKSLGYTDAEEIIGKRFSQLGRQGQIIGVVEDFNFESLHNKIRSLCLRVTPKYHFRKLSVRIQSGDMANTLTELEQLWNRLAPQRPFTYLFLDEQFNRHYKADRRFSEVFSVFTGIAIFIACLGLFGLIAHTARQRTKEIGIRKIVGASVPQIVILLSKDSFRLFFISLLVAIPGSWYAFDNWLNNFAYRIGIGIEVFAYAALITILITSATISMQTIRAAVANPINSLKDE